MGLTPDKTTESGKGSTDEETLKRLGIPELKYIIQLRKLSKIRDTYLEQFVRETNDDGYMRPSFNLHTVRTHRSSSSNPNFQNIPKRDKEAMEACRRAILPRPGHQLFEADFSALEVMISTCYHKDPVMLAYLENPESDMHLDMARQIFKCPDLPTHSILRKAAKNAFVFPQFYGDYYGNNAQGLCEWAEMPLGSWKNSDGVDVFDGIPLGKHMRSQGIKSYDQFVEHLKHVEDDFWNNRFKI
jgi:DNA polymerase-1